jgi:hypothetical protein
MLDLIQEVGSYAGLLAFLGVGVLALLHFVQARDVRRLRDWAGRAPERDAEVTDATSSAAAERAEEDRRREEERRRADQARQAEQQAAALREQRRRRREQGLPEQTRVERIRERIGGGPEGSRSPWYVALIVAAVLILGAGVAVLALEVLGEEEGNGGARQARALRPADVEVAALNGTAVPGLADRTGDRLEASGFQLGAVTNSTSSFARSTVMFTRGFRPEARRIARDLGIGEVEPMTAEIESVSAGADVSVVVGEDRAEERPAP